MTNHSQHNHSHRQQITRYFILGIILNTAYVILEAVFGLLTNSMSLLADAGHNLSDVLGLALALIASFLVARRGSKERTYGYRKSSILAAMFNAILLFVAVGALGYESVKRLLNPMPVESNSIIWVAGIGVIINFVTAMFFIRDKDADLNIRGAYLHMAADAAVSLGVVISGFIIKYSGINWIDPAVSLLIMLVIMHGTWDLLKESFNLAIDSVPASIDAESVEVYLRNLDGVQEIHDLHIWGMSTTETALTVHLIRPGREIDDDFTMMIVDDLRLKFGIAHATIQVEAGKPAMTCKDCGNGF